MNVLSRKKIDCHSCETTQCFVKSCSSDYISKLDKKKNQILLKNGQYIFQEGSPVFGIYFIQKGNVKIVKAGIEEKNQIVRLASIGHILGHKGGGRETYPINAIALNETRVCFLTNEVLYEAFKNNFEFAFSIMMFYSKELRLSELRTAYFAQMTVFEKVVYTLLYILKNIKANKAEKNIISIFSRQEIANIAGTNSEQVSRVVSALKKQNILSTEGKKIIIERKRELKALISYNKNDLV